MKDNYEGVEASESHSRRTSQQEHVPLRPFTLPTRPCAALSAIANPPGRVCDPNLMRETDLGLKQPSSSKPVPR